MKPHPDKNDEIQARYLEALALCSHHDEAMITTIALLENIRNNIECRCPRCKNHDDMIAMAAGVIIAELAMSSGRHPEGFRSVVTERIGLLVAPVTM